MSFLIGFISSNSQPILAQQDPHYTQYLFNGLVINPAYAGSRGTIATSLFFRKQWMGLDGAPTTQSFSFHLPDKKRRYGFGLMASNDQIGYVSQQWVNLVYAFRVPLGKGALALGLQGGFMNYKINWDKAVVFQASDPVLPGVPRNFTLPSVGTGIYYNTEYFFAGFSVPHLLNTSFSRDQAGVDDVARLYRHYLFTTGYVFGRISAVKFRPSVLVKYAEGAPIQADINFNFMFVDRVWAGVGWRSFDSMVIMAEFLINPQFKFGYSFDLTMSGLKKANSGSHEFMVSYEFLYSKDKLKSPRYF